MGGEQLLLLEKRIEKAIKLIEELKSREKKFNEEKKLLESRIKELTEDIESKNDLIDELKRSQRFLKEKIEVILDKLESIEIFENSSGFDINGVGEKGNEDLIELSDETKIIEDNDVVDLESVNSTLTNEETEEDEEKKTNRIFNTRLTDELSTDNEKENKLKSDTDVTHMDSKIKEDSNPQNYQEEIEKIHDNVESSLDKNTMQKESIEPDIEPNEDLKIIDGGKSLFGNQEDDTIDKDNTNMKEAQEGFLFNTGPNDSEIKNENKWFKNNPFI